MTNEKINRLNKEFEDIMKRIEMLNEKQSKHKLISDMVCFILLIYLELLFVGYLSRKFGWA